MSVNVGKFVGTFNVIFNMAQDQASLAHFSHRFRVRTGYGIMEKLWNFEKEIPYMEKLWNLSKTAVPMEKLWNFRFGGEKSARSL